VGHLLYEVDNIAEIIKEAADVLHEQRYGESREPISKSSIHSERATTMPPDRNSPDNVEGAVCCEIQFTDRGWCFLAWDGKRIAERRRGKWFSFDGYYTVKGDLDDIEVSENGVTVFGKW
jgi:hypothetical protein